MNHLSSHIPQVYTFTIIISYYLMWNPSCLLAVPCWWLRPDIKAIQVCNNISSHREDNYCSNCKFISHFLTYHKFTSGESRSAFNFIKLFLELWMDWGLFKICLHQVTNIIIIYVTWRTQTKHVAIIPSCCPTRVLPCSEIKI